MENEHRFCVACGAVLPEGAGFCPSCGANVEGGNNPHITGQINPGKYRSARPKATPLVLIYGILATVLGFMYLVMGVTISDQLFEEVMSMGYTLGMTYDQFIDMCIIYGAVLLVSGILALGSYMFCNKRGPKKYAVVLCLLASVVTLGTLAARDVTGVFLFVIGLIVTYMLYNDRNGFES